MDATGMSLDEIIKQKKIKITGFRKNATKINKKKATTGGRVENKFKGKPLKSKPVFDARNKIIQKNRAKIHDARDKLAQIAKKSGDARLKLLKKNIISLKKFGQLNTAINAMKRANNQSETIKPQKRLPIGNRSAMPYKRIENVVDMDVDMEYYTPSPGLRRTVKNEFSYVPGCTMPPLPTFKYIESAHRPDFDDPFDCYEVPVSRPFDVSEPRNLNRSVHMAQMEAIPCKAIHPDGNNGVSAIAYERMAHYKNEPISSKRYISDENSHLSHEMRVRLQRAPDVNQSAGIFTNPYSSSAREKQINAGYRIVVSNLHSSVSQSDIKELFEDVGTLLDARLVRTGVAEVIFEKLKDAQTAVDTYHNRQLDQRPMKCLLVNPRASNKPTAPAIKPTKPNLTKSSKVEIDIDALHSVLFRRA